MIPAGSAVVAGPRASQASLRSLLENLGARVVPWPGDEGLVEALGRVKPDLLVADAELSFFVSGRQRAEASATMAVVMLAVPGRPIAGDADDVLTSGHERERLLLALELGRSRRQAHELATERDQLRSASQDLVERLTTMLLGMLDRMRPGASDRARQVLDLAGRVAARFDIAEPHLSGLAIAARLHDVGWLMMPASAEDRTAAPVPAWSRAVGACTLLEPLPEFAPVAEVIGPVHENWDGTGHPDHLLSGQIPLRSRILRAVIDYLDALALDGASSTQVLDRMAEQAGTLYDPLVVVSLRAVLELSEAAGDGPGRAYLPVTELHHGMMLAEDLYTDGGIKLLARGTVLSEAALEIILRRHAQEPIVHGVAIHRPGGARRVR